MLLRATAIVLVAMAAPGLIIIGLQPSDTISTPGTTIEKSASLVSGKSELPTLR
jgi:hypothetical protein